MIRKRGWKDRSKTPEEVKEVHTAVAYLDKDTLLMFREGTKRRGLSGSAYLNKLIQEDAQRAVVVDR